MDKDIELLAKLVGKKSKDLRPADIRSLVGKSGSVAATRPGLPRTKCIVKAVEIDHDVKLLLQIGHRKIRRHISKFSWDMPVKKIMEVELAPEKVQCICEHYFKRHNRHMRGCPIHVLGLDRALSDIKTDILRETREELEAYDDD